MDLKVGLERLKNRVTAFRDEHLELSILPMMNDIADITNLNVRRGGEDNRTNFEFMHGHQIVNNELTGFSPIKFTVYFIKGTVITLYNREIAERIQNGEKFQTDIEQIMYISEQKRINMNHFINAEKCYEGFKTMGDSSLEDQVSQ